MTVFLRLLAEEDKGRGKKIHHRGHRGHREEEERGNE
jgi:hypothetical protein